MALSPGGKTLATGDGVGTVRLWSEATGDQFVISSKATLA